MTRNDDDDPYRDDPEGFQLLDPEAYNALDDMEQWAYLRAWCDADQRRLSRVPSRRLVGSGYPVRRVRLSSRR
jgi:hypothetical protein